MKLKEYLKDKAIPLVIILLTYSIIVLMLIAFKVMLTAIIGISVAIVLGTISSFTIDYYRKKTFYDEFLNRLSQLESKYFIIETIQPPTFYDGKVLVDSLYEINKSMIEQINKYQNDIKEFKEYIEMWIHEIKLPLATLTLMYHNNKNKVEQKYIAQLKRMDNYLEQILYYIRSEHAEKDYLITKVTLAKVIHEVALKNKDALLESKIELSVSDVTMAVYTDAKWLEFILNQLISNCIKYRKDANSYIKIVAAEDKEKVTLVVSDNGLGISSSDLPKVFNKSFTGKNGRKGAESTGMGLYIIKNLCTKLGHKIDIKSQEKMGTIVTLTFLKNNYYDVVK